MARIFFPTSSLNRFGVRDTNQRATLGAVDRFASEPTPRAAMTPTPPILGGVGVITEMLRVNGGSYSYPIRYPVYPYTLQPTSMAPSPTPPVSSSGGGGSTPSSTAPISSAPAPVSSQVLPTPTVTVPPPAPTGAVLVSSGGGTQTPATSPVVAPVPASSPSLVDNVAAWLSGSTTLFNYAIPNAVIAGVVVLGFAWLSSSSGKKR
jgi:hypothetical protein